MVNSEEEPFQGDFHDIPSFSLRIFKRYLTNNQSHQTKPMQVKPSMMKLEKVMEELAKTNVVLNYSKESNI